MTLKNGVIPIANAVPPKFSQNAGANMQPSGRFLRLFCTFYRNAAAQGTNGCRAGCRSG
jgi:hypothetical protein